MSKKAKQVNMFAKTNADLPIFSGTAQTVQVSLFLGAPAQVQMSLPTPYPRELACKMAEIVHVAVDSIGDYIGSDPSMRPVSDLHSVLDAMDAVLTEYGNIMVTHYLAVPPYIVSFLADAMKTAMDLVEGYLIFCAPNRPNDTTSLQMAMSALENALAEHYQKLY